MSCNCCHDKKPSPKPKTDGFGYNRLDGEARDWAENNNMPKTEFCVRVNGGKRFGGPDWIKRKCGDGRMGFTTRRRNQTETKMEVGIDGQYKKSRGTNVRPRSARAVASRRPKRVDGSKCGLASIIMARDPIDVAKQERLYKKSKRARNRNNKARRGHRRIIKSVT